MSKTHKAKKPATPKIETDAPSLSRLSNGETPKKKGVGRFIEEISCKVKPEGFGDLEVEVKGYLATFKQSDDAEPVEKIFTSRKEAGAWIREQRKACKVPTVFKTLFRYHERLSTFEKGKQVPEEKWDEYEALLEQIKNFIS